MPREDVTVTPQCCEEVQKHGTVFLRFSSEAIYNEEEGQENFKPTWRSFGWSEERQHYSTDVKFCPHCSKEVPDIKKRVTNEKICAVKDGGYYCATCGERLNVCNCYPCEYAWELKDRQIH